MEDFTIGRDKPFRFSLYRCFERWLFNDTRNMICLSASGYYDLIIMLY